VHPINSDRQALCIILSICTTKLKHIYIGIIFEQNIFFYKAQFKHARARVCVCVYMCVSYYILNLEKNLVRKMQYNEVQ